MKKFLIFRLPGEPTLRPAAMGKDYECVGAISYGESLMAKSDATMCVVKVTCGFHSAAVNMSADGEIQVRWSLNGPLELIKK